MTMATTTMNTAKKKRRREGGSTADQEDSDLPPATRREAGNRPLPYADASLETSGSEREAEQKDPFPHFNERAHILEALLPAHSLSADLPLAPMAGFPSLSSARAANDLSSGRADSLQVLSGVISADWFTKSMECRFVATAEEIASTVQTPPSSQLHD